MNPRSLVFGGSALAIAAFASLGAIIEGEPHAAALATAAQDLISRVGWDLAVGPTAMNATVIIAGQRHRIEIVKAHPSSAAVGEA